MALHSAATVVVACAANGCYALPLAVTLRSLVANLSPEYEVEVYVLDDGLDQAGKDKVRESLPARLILHWVQPRNPALSGLPTWGRMPLTTYLKLTLAEWIPAGTEKLLWLDCDLLVLADIARLWNTSLAGRHLLAVPDPRVPHVSSRFGIAAYRRLGIAPEARYFNAGVMLIDAARWKAEAVAGRVIDYLKQHRDEVFFMDQEGLNAVLAGKWGELDPRWNWHPTAAGDPRSLDSAWIAHYSGRLKPWIYGGSHPHQQIYYRYLDQTAWAGSRPKHNWKSMFLNAYASSPLRRLIYPAELWATHLERAFTRSYHRTGEKPDQ